MEKYLEKDFSIDERVSDLLSKMTLEEKVVQIQCQGMADKTERNYAAGCNRDIVTNFLSDENVTTGEACAELQNEEQRKTLEASRLKIPALFHGEALHGIFCGKGTIFPQSIGLASTWDEQLVHQVGDAIAKECKCVGIRQVLAPVINVVRDSRWGRMQETYGECPYLSSKIGVAYVKGLEQNNVVATLKHYVDNYGDGGRDSGASNNSWRCLREVFFPPFEECIREGGARSVMASYNSFDGVPCSADDRLLDGVLRQEWGFQGIVVSDYFSVAGHDFHDPNHPERGMIHGLDSAHFTTKSRAESKKTALENGLDVEFPYGDNELLDICKKGLVSEKALNQAVSRVLRLKFELGLFENPYVDSKKADDILLCEDHKKIAVQAARESIVLLKNNNDTLPLSKSIKNIGVFGPAKDKLLLGIYSPKVSTWDGDFVNPLEGIKAAVSENTNILVHQDEENAAELAKKCDVVLFFATTNGGEGIDITSLDLPNTKQNLPLPHLDQGLCLEGQMDLLKEVVSTGVKTVVVLLNGAAVTMTEWYDKVDAIVEAWYGGLWQGTAIAEVLFGDYNPGGKLPITFPQTVGQSPLYYNYKPYGRLPWSTLYGDAPNTPLFPFGYGLSYTTFEYTNLKFSADTIVKNGELTVSVDVKNTGGFLGDEVVQLYIRHEGASVVMPIKELRGFKRITLQPNESKTVTFLLTSKELSLWNKQLERVVELETIKVMIGSSSEDIRLQGSFEIIG